MADLSEFDELAPAKQAVCKIARLIEQLSDEDREKLAEVLPLQSKYSSSTVERWFRKRGLDARGDAIRRHRRGECCCG